MQAEEERKRLIMEWEQKRELERELERERQWLEKEEIRQYKKYLAGLRVGPFDQITIKEIDNDTNVRKITVNARRNCDHDIFIGLKYGETFSDKRGIRWRIVDIKKMILIRELNRCCLEWQRLEEAWARRESLG